MINILGVRTDQHHDLTEIYMCGIAGYWSKEIIKPHLFNRLRDTFERNHNNRGPDAFGCSLINSGSLGLFHNRLKIVDLTDRSNQPLQSHCGRLHLVFNGEIYNFRELANNSRLSGKSYAGDTEVLLELFAQYEFEQVLGMIEGMFALALYDTKRNCLFLARDRFGQKPLFFSVQESFFAFASTSRAIASLRQRSFNPLTINEFLRYGYSPSGESIYDGIDVLDPGCFLEISLGAQNREFTTSENIYFVRDNSELGNLDACSSSYDQKVNKLERAIIRSIDLTAKADVSVGILLSGGIDSSLVAALAAKTLYRPLETFTLGFTDHRYDESKYAIKIAKKLGMASNILKVDEEELFDAFETSLDAYDEPFGDSSAVPTFLISQYAKQQVGVVLSGDGGDEFFGGYNRHIYATKYRMLRQILSVGGSDWLYSLAERLGFKHAFSLLSGLGAPSGARPTFLTYDKFCKALKYATCYDPERYYELLTEFTDSQFSRQGELLSCRAKRDWKQSFNRQVMALDVTQYLPNDILTKIDRASMASSLEARAPLLSSDIFMVSRQFETRELIRSNQGKRPLRTILRRYLPRELFERPKHGFSIPLDRYIDRVGRQQLLTKYRAHEVAEIPGLDPDVVVSQLKKLEMGGNDSLLWNFCVLGRWLGKSNE